MPDTNKHELPPRNPPGDPRAASQRKAVALARLLDEWMQGDDAEQRETFELLRVTLDEHRLEGYKLFS